MVQGTIRFLDVIFSAIGLVLGFPIFLVVLAIGYVDTGAPIFRQQRVGKGEVPFILLKFRTMPIGTASVASHLLEGAVVSPYGRFIRRTKLDELPQLWNVLRGDMSLVGARPCLPSQEALVAARRQAGVFVHRPGITGLAQLSGIDMSTPELLAKTDAQMLRAMSVYNYFRYIYFTLLGKGFGDRIRNS